MGKKISLKQFLESGVWKEPTPFRFASFSLLFLSFFALLYLIPTKGHSSHPVVNGMVDLHGKDHFALALEGEWEFARNALTFHDWKEAEYTVLPHTWSDSRFGYASYRITIYGLIPGHAYCLRVPYMGTAYMLYLDRTLLAKNGVVGTSRENSRPGYFPQVVEFHAREDHAELILQVSNFDHRRGGAFQSILLADPDTVWQVDYWSYFIDWAFVAVFLTMSVYQLAFWIIRRDRAIWLLATLLLVIGINGMVGTPNVLIFTYLPDFPWELYQKICYYLSYSIPVLLLLFLYELYGGMTHKSVFLLLVPYAAILLFVTLSPARFYSPINSWFQIYAFLLFSVGFAVVFQALIAKRPGSRVLLIAMLILFGSVLSSAYFSNDRISMGTYLPLSFLEYYNIHIRLNSLPVNVASYLLLLMLINLLSLAYFFKHPDVTRRKISNKEMGGNLSLQKQSRELGLSGREQEIALLMLQGKTNKEISDTLFISMSTTKTHISRIFKKATVSTRSELFFLFYNGDSSVVDG